MSKHPIGEDKPIANSFLEAWLLATMGKPPKNGNDEQQGTVEQEQGELKS